MLKRLQGRRHEVWTGLAIVHGDESRTTAESTTVHMARLADEDLDAYLQSGESLDKAGAYAAQGEGRRFIDRILGSESNVIGLPMDETLALLRGAGLRPPAELMR
jgi:septum formation protein